MKSNGANRVFSSGPGKAPVADSALLQFTCVRQPTISMSGDTFRSGYLKDVSLSEMQKACAQHNWTLVWDQEQDHIRVWARGLTASETLCLIIKAIKLRRS